jgi:hypothetical protein
MMLPITPHTLATFFITAAYSEMIRDPQGFIDTCDEGFNRDIDYFAELAIIDDFDCPDDLYNIFIPTPDDAREQALFDLKHDEEVYRLVVAGFRELRALAPSFLPKEKS